MLVELLLTIGLMAIILPAILTGIIASRQGKPQQIQRVQAVALLKETEQAVRSARDIGWTSFATFSATPLHPVISGSHWALTSGSETINNITRQVIISDVYRNSDGTISQSGGTIDPSSKKITITVSWTLPLSSSISSTLYFMRTNNATQNQTTQTDFNAGTRTNVVVQSTSGTGIAGDGQIQLATSNGDWCNPSSNIVSNLTLSKPANAIVAFPGATLGAANSAYLGTGNGTSGVSFANISITDTSPPVPTITGTYSSSDTTNAIYTNNGYAFLATNATTNQVKIIKLSNNTLYKTINLGSNLPANGIYIANNVLYVTSGQNIYTYDVTNVSSITQLPTKAIWCPGFDIFGLFCNNSTATEQIVAVGTKVYVTISNSLLGVQIFSIGTGGVLSLWSVGQLTWSANAHGLAVNNTGDRTYVAFDSVAPPPGFYIIDTAQADRWCLLGICYSPQTGNTYNDNGLVPKGMTLATSDIALLVGTGGSEQYQVIKNLTTDNPTHCGGMAVASGANGVAAVNQLDNSVYSYLISNAGSNQFKIIQGGSGGGSSSFGSFESSTIDASSSSVFNRFSATVSQPANTSIQMQIGVAQAPAPGTSCNGATFTYLGPNGSSSAYFTPIGATISGQIPLGNYVPSYSNPARCFRYRANLSTTNASYTPALYDVTTNYSQ